MRFIWLILCFCAASTARAQTLAGGFADLGFGTLDTGADAQTGSALRAEAAWDLGAVGLQVGAQLATLDGETDAALRAILTKDLRWPVRLGLSVAYATDDLVRDDAVNFGLHAIHRTDWHSLELNLLLPNHIRETGAFSFTFAGEQWLTRDLSIKTELFRLSTDPEEPDFYTISLRLAYAVNDRWTVFAQGYQTVSDTYLIKNNGTHLGLAYQLSETTQITATLDQLRPEAAEAALGVTLGVSYDFGSARDDGVMFQSAIRPDRLRLGRF